MNQFSQRGYTSRPATKADAGLVCQLWNARSQWVRNTSPYRDSAAVEKSWNHPQFDLTTDSLLVFDPDSILIGYAHIKDVANPPVDVFCANSVHPDHDNEDELWEALLDWIDAEARRVIPKAPADARIALVAGARGDDVSEQAHLETFGFEHSRTFHRMMIEFSEPVNPQAVPEGIVIRTFVRGRDDELIVTACRNAFRDHYGHLEQPFEADLAKWRRWMDDDDFDPSLWFLAIDTAAAGKIAGYCCCYPTGSAEANMGMIDEIGVCREWQRHGIGRSLLTHSLKALQDRRVKGATLRVDTGNRNQALTFYGTAGFHATSSSHTYVKELRPGTNLVAQ